MLRASQFSELVSGQARGLWPTTLRALLAAGEMPYRLAMSGRNWAYDRGLKSVHRATVPVISIGNLTLGGTGKTPLVKWVARYLRARDFRVTILSRGYGAAAGGVNDEALELEQALPDVPHVQNPDRVAGAKLAVEELAAQVLLLDDGFQHRRLARELDIVLLDATNPWGHGHVFPRGLLRESPRGLRRAGVVCLSRATAIEASARAAVRERVARLAPHAAWCEVEHTPQRLLATSGATAELDWLRGQRVVGCCAIGNPAAFRRTLATLGAEVVGWHEWPDHHNFTRDDVATLAGTARALQAAGVVCTHKDLVKLRTEELGGVPLWAVEVDIRLLAGEAELATAIDAVLADVPPDDWLGG